MADEHLQSRRPLLHDDGAGTRPHPIGQDLKPVLPRLIVAYILTDPSQTGIIAGKGRNVGLGPFAHSFFVNGVEIQVHLGKANRSHKTLKPRQVAVSDTTWFRKGDPSSTGNWISHESHKFSPPLKDDPDPINVKSRPDIVAFFDSPGIPVNHELMKWEIGKGKKFKDISRIHLVQNFMCWLEDSSNVVGGRVKWASIVSLIHKKWNDPHLKNVPKWEFFLKETKVLKYKHEEHIKKPGY